MAPTVDALSLLGTQKSRRRHEICNASGRGVGESSLVPPIAIRETIRRMREAPSLARVARYRALQRAADLYESACLADLTPEAYVALVSSVTGLDQAIVGDSLKKIAHSLRDMPEILNAGLPRGSVWEQEDTAADAGCGLFSRRGEVLSVIAAGNGPGVHGLWPQAVGLGYRTLVKPSLREPFTAQRLVSALSLAGLEAYVALVPTDHAGAEALIADSDLSLVYGGPEIAARYGQNPRVLVQGPGRSKLVVGKDVPHDEALELVAKSVLSLGGAACVSASAVLVEDDAPGFALKLRKTLLRLCEDYPPRAGTEQEAEAYERLLASDDVPWHSAPAQGGNGRSLTPHVALVEHASDARVQRELPFPCVTVAPFDASVGFAALSGSLVVTMLSRRRELIDKLLADTSIASVFVGAIPTTRMDPRIPHDGYLSDFLMRNRAIRIDRAWLRSTSTELQTSIHSTSPGVSA
jgi:acyl-CoA reductase-like NAD-dependent aldehyde dehydrogenase